jgi:glutamine phosphoribosylpyrophosphate amidotransferase
MCGIAAYVGKKQPINKLMFLMFDNDSRGGHSSGAYIDKSIYKCTEKSGNLLHMIKESNAELFIGHTRYATHGSKKANNTHPYTYAKDVKEVAKNKLFIYNSNGDLVNTINIKVTAQEYVGKNWYDYKSNHNNILTYNDYESYENPNQINIWDNPNEYLSEEESIEFEYETSMLLQEKLNFFKEYDVYTPEEIKQIEKLIAIINEKYWEF